MNRSPRSFSLLLLSLVAAVAASAVNFSSTYSENFDSMGTAGTTPPSGWSVIGAFSGTNTTWTSSISASSVVGGTATTALTAATAYTGTSNTNGFNYALTTSTSDRSLGTSPTTGPGIALQLSLTNTSGAAINGLQIRYDIRRFTAAASANELPGYWLFYSLDNGATWNSVAALNPTITNVPNTAGVTTIAPTSFALASAWANNSTLLLRWVDDNAQQTSPDQVIGLDNLSIATVPVDATKTALFFNGANQYVTMGAATSTLGAGSFTLECWFKRTGTGVATSTGTGGVTNAIPLVTKGRGEAEGSNVDCNYFLGIDNTTGKLCADFEAQAGVSGITPGQNYPVIGTTVIANDVWYHAAATYDTATYTWKLYLNGVQDATFTNPTGAAPRNDSIQHFGIGSAFTSTGVAAGFFQGVIDEARVWNVARTAPEIAAARNGPITSPQAGLLAVYGFNEGSGATAGGVVSTAPNGTVTNSPLWVDGAPFVSNNPPTVSLAAPTAGTTAGAPGAYSLAATAADSDGTISLVEFLRDGAVVGTASVSPYNFSDTGVPAGLHTYAARATDNNGAVTTSASVTVSVLTDITKSALLFDGSNDYVTMGVAPALNVGGPPSNGFTLECWFRKEGAGVTSSSGNGGVVGVPLFGKGRGEAENSNVDCNYFFGINAAGQLVADFEAYPASGITAGQNYPITATNAAIVNNTWYHAAATYDGTTATWTLYLNGVQVGTATAATNALPRYDSIQHFGIGAAFTSTGVAEGAFAGRIDEVRVWNYARSAAEIAAARDFEIATAPGLVGRYGLNEATGTTAGNSAGVAGAPVGTLTNGPLWVDGAPLAANTPPVVTLDAPAENTTVLAGASVNLSATASDADGVVRVEFYAGATKVGEDTTSPYAFSWTTAATGDFTLTAKAIDALGTSTISNAVTLHVAANSAPSVALTAPADNATQVAPGAFTLTADASDTDGTVAKVEFFNGATKLGEALSAPFSYDWTGIAAGDYSITAKATDNLGASATTTAITVHVTVPNTVPPTVSLTAPADGAHFVAPASITLTASAADSDGTVTKVEFFNGAAKIGEAVSSPFTINWTNVALGDYVLTAKATDDQTATAISAPITVHVQANQPPVVTLTAPADHATGIGASTNLQLGIADPEGDAQTVTFYGRVTVPATPQADFSVIAIPDTQFYSENLNSHVVNGSVGANASIYYAQTQWIVDNLTARKIAFVSHMGDIAQNGDARESEWIVADTAMKMIENPVTTLMAHGIPWGVAPGNHDQQPIGDAGGVTNFYTKYFNFTRWDSRPYYGGHFGNKPVVSGGATSPANTNNYELFSAGGLDFIVVHMEYDIRAQSFYQPVLDWADALLKAYPDRRAIITSHWIVNTGNPATFSTQGQAIYDALKNNPNLFLMLCGHVNGEGMRADTYQGRTVYSILQDYQETTNGGNGFLRIYTFSPTNNTITLESYSPTLNRAVNASDSIPGYNASPIVLPYNMQGAVTGWIPLGTVNVQAGETSASLAWTGLEAGKNYEWYATVNDGVNTVTTPTRRFTAAAGIAPTVAMATPTDGQNFGQGSTIALTATANDVDGTVSKVEYFNGASKIGESTAAPFTFNWTNVPGGTYTLRAAATDNSGRDTLSAPVVINVSNFPPTVSLTTPDPAATFEFPASILISADAADSDGSIAKVEFYAGTSKIGESIAAPFTFTWTNAATGNYDITAKATDNSGAVTTSSPISISVVNAVNDLPTVSITSPVAGIVTPGTINIVATAADTDGTIAKVEFFNGATKLGEDTSAPFAYGWTGVAVGTYTLTAVATDNNGGTTTSSPVTINVQNAPLSLSQNFDGLGTGTALPAGWSFYGYTVGSNSTWVSSIPENTVAGGTANATLIATTTFDLTNTKSATQGYNFALAASPTDRALGTSPTSTEGVALQWSVTNTSSSAITAVRLGYDTRRFTAAATANELPGYWVFYSLDGGTTWTNVAALNPTLSGPSGVIVPNTTGVTTVSPTDVTLSSTWGVGANLLIRWVDDNAVATSADQIVGLDNVTLSVAQAAVGNPPGVSLTAPANGATYFAPATVSLAADAADTDGTVSKVEFYSAATKLGEDTAAPFTFDWTGVAAGSYSLTARATDNDGNLTTSTPIVITVNAAPGSGTLTRGPYLQKAAPTQLTVRWRSSQSIAGRVRYGTSAGNLDHTVDESTGTAEHIVTLTGLAPATTYFYSIGSAFDTLLGDATTTFTTPPVAGTSVPTRIWALGDAGTASSSQTAVRDAFYNWTGTRTPDFVLQLGDNAYNSGLDTEFQSAMFNIYGAMLRKTPFWSCLGNHETNQATAFVNTYPYFDIYTFPTAGESGGVASGTEHYYSFDYGAVHVISLDSMTADRSPTGAMATWLQSDLASTTATWIICIFHHPPYTKGSHNSDTETELIQMRQNLDPILEAGGVDLVLNGHSHCYERSYLLDGHYGLSTTLTPAMKLNAGDGRPSGNGAYVKPLTGPRDHFGTVYNVAGSAGQISGGSLNHPANYISLNNLGSVVLDINGTRLDATFLRENGTVSDSYTIIKQGAADSDGDGISDDYEIANGLDRHNPADADLDLDGDGLSNRVEYALGTPANSPTNPGAPVLGSGTGVDAGKLTFTFNRARTELTYTVQASDDQTNWVDIAVNPGSIGSVTVIDQNTTSPNRYLRLKISDGVTTVYTPVLQRSLGDNDVPAMPPWALAALAVALFVVANRFMDKRAALTGKL